MKPFKPKKYMINRELLERWRSNGDGTHKIAARFGCDQSTVRNWLIRLKLPTARPNVSRESTGLGAR